MLLLKFSVLLQFWFAPVPPSLYEPGPAGYQTFYSEPRRIQFLQLEKKQNVYLRCMSMSSGWWNKKIYSINYNY